MNTITCSIELPVLGLPIEMQVEVTYEHRGINQVRLFGERIKDRLDRDQLEEIARQVCEYEGIEHLRGHQ